MTHKKRRYINNGNKCRQVAISAGYSELIAREIVRIFFASKNLISINPF